MYRADKTLMMLLVNTLLQSHDLRTRCSIRSQLESGGVLSIMVKLQAWREDYIDKAILTYNQEAEADRKELIADQKIDKLQNMRSPEEICRALLQTTRGTKSSAYLLSIFQHLAFVPDHRERYYQLISRLIESIVMSDSPDIGHDFSRAFGISVSHLIGKFVEQDRLDTADKEIKKLRFDLQTMEREKGDLAAELSSDSLVSELKQQIADLEHKLKSSRAATDSLRNQMDGMKVEYETRITDLEKMLQELFDMLYESQHLDTIIKGGNGPIDRQTFVNQLWKEFHVKRTIKRLEGGTDTPETPEEIVLPAEVATRKVVRTAAPAIVTRDSNQFLDATDDDVRAHIETALVRSADHIVSTGVTLLISRRTGPPRPLARLHEVRQ